MTDTQRDQMEAENEQAVSEESPQTEEDGEVFAEGGEPEDAAGEETEETTQEGGPAPEKKGFFKKKEKRDKKDEQIEDLTDRLKRSMAEDNFERGMATLKEDEAQSPFAEGMDKIYKQLLTTLESLDVTVIEAVGQEFNPDFHNAVMHVEDEEAGENVVVEEFQKGYLYRGGVVRHSMVKVAN